MGQKLPNAFDPGDVFDLAERIDHACTPDDAWRAVIAVTSPLGLSYGELRRFSSSSTESQSNLITEVMPRGYSKGYSANALWQGDLLLERAKISGLICFAWNLSDWPRDRLSSSQRQWVEHNQTFGIEGGICLLTFRPGEQAALILCGRPLILSPRDLRQFAYLCQQLTNRLFALAEGHNVGAVWLSEREQECLRWAAIGKTDWEIGQILSLSEKTVNVYITRAKTKFGVKSRAQAILMAAKAGHISI